MNNNLPIATPDDQSIVIRIPKSKMKDFIGDVLKTKRRIGRRYNLVFNLKKDDVLGIISVIDHRVREQNEADLIDISIDVLYDDGSSREYKGLDQFTVVDDNLKATSLVVVVVMSYLVKFNGDETPTQNEVRIFASSSSENFMSNETFNEASLRIFVETNKFTWAEDIINNFTNYVKDEFREPSKLYKFIRRFYLERPASGFVLIFLMLGVFMLMLTYFRDVASVMALDWRQQSEHLVGDTLSAANAKLDFLIEQRGAPRDLLFNAESMIKFGAYLLTYILITMAAPLSYLAFSNNSYVSIGRVSERKNLARISRFKLLKSSVLFVSGLSVVCSMFASYIYERLGPLLD